MRVLVLACAFGLVASGVGAQPPDPIGLLRFEAPVEVPTERGLVRLPLPPEVFAEVRPDLSDLRLHDADGTERAFVVHSAFGPVAPDAEPLRFLAPALAIERRVSRASDLPREATETVTLMVPGPAPEATHYRLVIQSAARRFLRHVTVTREDGAVLAEADVFRFPQPPRQHLDVELPAEASGRLRVTLVGEGAYLEPTFAFVAEPGARSAPLLSVPLVVEEVRHVGDETHVTVTRPLGLVPERLRLEARDEVFHRGAEVFERGLASRRALGRGAVFRLAEVADGGVRDIPIRRAEGRTLEVVLTRGDSAPLEGLRISAVVRQPVLVFEAAGVAWLRFGGGRLRERSGRAEASLGGGWSAVIDEAVFAPDRPAATLGTVRDNPRFRDEPALAFAGQPGAAIDTSAYTHRAPIEVRGADEGLARVVVPPSILAHALGDLADLRITDAEGRQRPFLVDPHGTVEVVPLRRVETSERDGRTVYRLMPPDGPLPAAALRVRTGRPFLRRPYEVARAMQLDNEPLVVLVDGLLERDPADGLADLRIALSGARVEGLELRITDGGDARIDDLEALVEAPLPVLHVAAPDGDYILWSGHAEGSAPDYDLARAEELVLAVRPSVATVGPTAPNAAYREPPPSGETLTTWMLWVLLGLAVVVLGFLTWRAAAGAPEAEGDTEA